MKAMVISLPKTATSTLGVMMQIMGLRVTGSNLELGPESPASAFDPVFDAYDGFQDYPWPFVYERYLPADEVRFIFVRREFGSWWNSFLNSYGSAGEAYLSHAYMRIPKEPSFEDSFRQYFEDHEARAVEASQRYPGRFLFLDIDRISWEVVAGFLETQPPPGDPPVPRVNRKAYEREARGVLRRFLGNVARRLPGPVFQRLMRRYLRVRYLR